MRNIFIPVLLISLGMITGCGSAIKIYTDIDDEGRFEQYSTYNFMDFTEGNKKTISQTELEGIRVAFARGLEQRGLRFVTEDGDVSVKITVYHRQAMNGYYGHPWRTTFMERAISIDMYDNKSMKHVWHCAAVDELEYDSQERDELLPGLVASIFEKYPVKSGEEI